MKFLLTSLFLPLFYFSSQAQTPDCSSVRTGTFRIRDVEDNTETIIIRNKKYQIEANESMNEKVKLSVTWVNDCTYELRLVKVIKGEPRSMRANDKLIVKILSVEGDIIRVQASSNFAPQVLKFEMEIIK